MQVTEQLIGFLGRTCAGMLAKRMGHNTHYGVRDNTLAGFSVLIGEGSKCRSMRQASDVQEFLLHDPGADAQSKMTSDIVR
jgi:hypothetical protein